MTKRLLTLLLTITLLTPIANAAVIFTYNGLNYSTTSASTVSVSKSPNASGSVVIPEIAHNIYYTYSNGNYIKHDDAYTVTTIDYSAFFLCRGLTSVTIGNSVTTIGRGAFQKCTGLTSVTIGNSVTTIDSWAFSDCTGLKTVNWNAKACTTISGSPNYLFEDSNISIINFGNEVEIIPSYLCSGQSGLTSINIPNSVTTIGRGAFQKCTGLTSVTIGNSVTSIGSNAFYECSGLTGNLNIPNSVTTIGSYAFYKCSGLTGNLNIPNSVTSIGESAFEGCSGLTGELTIPNSVTSIGMSAFSYCRGLTSVTIGNSVTTIGRYAFSHCTGLTSVDIENSIIGEYQFSDCTGLTSITIPNSVTSIGGCAFYRCSGLKSATIGNAVTSIGGSAFNGCSGLTSITIPNSVTSIGWGAFCDCSGLTGELTIPNSVTSIGSSAFSGCSGLTSIKVGNENTVYDSRNNCNAIIETKTNTLIAGCKNTVIPNSVTSIGGGAFGGCSGLTGELTIPNSVTTIGNGAFRGCSGLTSVIIPNSVTEIGLNAFYGCSGLKNIYSHIQHPENVALGGSVFESVPKDVCTLHVPRGTVPVYRRCVYWYYFLNIVDDVDDVDGTTTIVIPATALELNPKHLVLHPGESADITAVFTPQYPTVTLLDWATDDEEVATVNGKGHVTALNTGRVTISATTIDLSDITATCTLQVVPEGASVVPGDVDGSAMVDVDDVNAMINLILLYDQYKDQYPGSADLDGNGMVDVDDVNALINMILAK